MRHKKSFKFLLLTTSVVLLAAYAIAQDDPTLKPDKALTDKKRAKKSAKEEKKIHDQSQKDMANSVNEFHKSKYKKHIKKQRAKVNKGL